MSSISTTLQPAPFRSSQVPNGVGVSVVNALSSWLKLEIKREGKVYYQEYEKGLPQTSLDAIGMTDRRGTKITFLPDPEMFKLTEFSYTLLAQRLLAS